MIYYVFTLLLLTYIQTNYCFNNPVPTKSLFKNIRNIGSISVIEPFYDYSFKTNAVLFFTGGSGYMPQDIYTLFLNGAASQNITCYTYNPSLENIDKLINILSTKHNELSIVGHSSGCMTALKSIKNADKIKSVVLFDPVDDRIIYNIQNNPYKTIFEKNDKTINIDNIDNFVIIKAGKSYKWNIFPFKVPFIPLFELKTDNIVFNEKELSDCSDIKFDNDYEIIDTYYDNNDNVIDITNYNENDKLNNTICENKINNGIKTIIEFPGYGHCDILDNKWSNIMHKSIAEGIENRDDLTLRTYRELCVDLLQLSFQDKLSPKIIRENIKEYDIKKLIKRL